MPRVKKESTKKPEKEVKKTASKVKIAKTEPKAKKIAPVKAAKTVKEVKKVAETVIAKSKAPKVKKNQSKEDTGSVDFQIQNFSDKIKLLAKHLKSHTHDFDSRRGLLIMVGKRRRLLNYLKKSDPVKYEEVYKALKLKA